LEGKALRLVFKAARIAGCTGRRGEGELGENGEGLGLSQGRGEGLRRECPRGSAAKAGVGLLEGGSGRVGQLSGARPRSDENKADASPTLPKKVLRALGREIGNGSKAAERIGETRREGGGDGESSGRARLASSRKAWSELVLEYELQHCLLRPSDTDTDRGKE